MVLTLMFVRPLYREKLMRSICAGSQENGCLLLGAGFREVEVFFKWDNFVGIVAVK